jgi:tetratricopeptide (TPR) repeat protein
MGQARFEVAIRHLERATLRHPDYAFGWYALGYAYRQIRRYDLAVMCYETFVALRPDEADPHFGLAMAHKAAGETAATRLALQRYLQLERRPERAAFVARARAELDRLGPPAGEVPRGELTLSSICRALDLCGIAEYFQSLVE